MRNSPLRRHEQVYTPLDIPERLKYREPTVNVDYSGVQPRYLSPPKPRYVDDKPRPVTTPKNPQFAHVESRFRSPPRERSSPVHEEIIPKSKSIKMTPEYLTHKTQAKEFRHVPSKYFDVYTSNQPSVAHPEVTPRAVVEARLKQRRNEISKVGQPFHNAFTKSQGSTFEDIKKHNPQYRRLEERVAAHKGSGHSVVMDWIERGIPIPQAAAANDPKQRANNNNSRATSPAGRALVRGHSPKPFYTGGGAGNGTYTQRATSPLRSSTAREKNLVDSLKNRLQNPSASAPQTIQETVARLSRVRTPTVSPIRMQQPQPQRPNSRPQATTTTLQRRSPTRNASSSSTAAVAVNSMQRISRPADSVAAQGPPRAFPVSPPRTQRANDVTEFGSPSVDVQISAVSDATAGGFTPDSPVRATPPPKTFVPYFVEPPHLASP